MDKNAIKVEKHDGFYEVEFEFSTPQCRKFDLLAKFWSSARKRLKEKTGLDVIATFSQHGEITSGIIIPSRVNMAGGEYGNEEFSEHCKLLDDKLGSQLDEFVEALNEFKDNSDAYAGYLWCIMSSVEDDDDSLFHELTNRFLLGIGLKTPEDERKKAEFAKKLAEATKK